MTASFAMSAPPSSICKRRLSISSLEGVREKSWLDTMVFTPFSLAKAVSCFKEPDREKSSRSTRSEAASSII